ncbi:hypothetical protein DF18_07140 [Streptomyces rimosus]|nr:hypothetical protein DF18_07140 [Streptomyces rimosus]
MPMKTGAASTQTVVMPAISTVTSVRRRLAYASPPSSSFFMARTSCGMNTAFRAPPPTRM